ncbi:uncharacterized protein At2g39795, mitochondrial-like [Rhodamnia argentea]|uniref:Uncharacterized protein At2g39795, mitochondrial-like n=1 Tax=Rhodamnia argentea TaxID=178133 RepID=A0A8B8PIW0_9MYRT|nr:uncharacterized protein At2g39795, mitochondrial-like [Rhodamnia argentea]
MAAFSSILRRSASSFAPVAVRALRSQRNCHSAIFTALNQARIVSSEPRLSPFLPPRSYSTKRPSSDETLRRILESEIQCAEETDDHDRVEEAPGGFPFQIEDKPGFQTITLSREYEGEEIKVEVSMPDLVTGEDGDDNNQDDHDEKANQSSIPLVVSIAKGNGQFIEFGCTAYPDEIVIDSLAVKNPEDSEDQIAYEGPDFQDLDENLQKAFHKYLEIRGIKPSTTNFLHEYMINKDSREYLMWLKNLKKFVEA